MSKWSRFRARLIQSFLRPRAQVSRFRSYSGEVVNDMRLPPFAKRSRTRLLKDERGSSIVELAIVFPILLILFVGVAEIGRLFYTYTTLAKATKMGARFLTTEKDAEISPTNPN